MTGVAFSTSAEGLLFFNVTMNSGSWEGAFRGFPAGRRQLRQETFAGSGKVPTFAPHFAGPMYAIVDIAGQQFKVKAGQKLKVHRMEAEEGKHVELGNVLLVSNGSTISVGTPTVDGFRIAAKVLRHDKGDKVLVFKKKRRKGYKKMNGHRQYLTELWIESILGKGEKFDAAKSTAPKLKPVVAEKPKAAKPVKAAAAEAKAPAKKAPAKKAPAKKAAPKKTTKK